MNQLNKLIEQYERENPGKKAYKHETSDGPTELSRLTQMSRDALYNRLKEEGHQLRFTDDLVWGDWNRTDMGIYTAWKNSRARRKK